MSFGLAGTIVEGRADAEPRVSPASRLPGSPAQEIAATPEMVMQRLGAAAGRAA